LFCPPGHLPAGFLSGLPLPGPSSIWANATPENDIVSAIMSAVINKVMRLRISFLSPILPMYTELLVPIAIVLLLWATPPFPYTPKAKAKPAHLSLRWQPVALLALSAP